MQAEALLVPATVAAGWLGQACFFARFFVQWLASERAGTPVVPRSFWWLSLVGSASLSGYAVSRGQSLLLFGFLVTGVIAARNLVLENGHARNGSRGLPWIALVVTVLVVSIELAKGELTRADSPVWLAVAGVGQLLWTARFPLQWILSERAGRSYFPPVFWWMSLAGNVLLLAYALHLRDPVFVLGFLPGPVLQLRNLVLMRRSSAHA